MRRRVLETALALAVGSLTVLPVHADWRDHASVYDIKRIAHVAEARERALSEAQGAGAKDLSVIRSVMNRPAQPSVLAALAGTWRCRTIKLGGMSADVIYSWFTCRIAVKDGIAHFEKRTGSQHFSGTLYPRRAGGFVLLAGMNVTGEKPVSYSGSGPSIGAHTTESDAVGLLTYTGGRTARIEFPYPAQESTMDVIEMRR